MPSPFPGMDPFMESQKWIGFHSGFVAAIAEAVTSRVRPRYVVDVEADVYRADGVLIPFVSPNGNAQPDDRWLEPHDGGSMTGVTRCVLTLPMTEPIEIPYLVIRRRDNEETVTVIELLSPTNKSSRDGRVEYLAKRNLLLRSRAHLVEIDLLRGGERLPTVEPHPAGDYFTIVSRVERRPRADVYAWTLDHPLPRIPIPLTDGDPDVTLDLQAVFTTTYDRAGYDYALHYERPVDPTLETNQLQWAGQRTGRAVT